MIGSGVGTLVTVLAASSLTTLILLMHIQIWFCPISKLSARGHPMLRWQYLFTLDPDHSSMRNDRFSRLRLDTLCSVSANSSSWRHYQKAYEVAIPYSV